MRATELGLNIYKPALDQQQQMKCCARCLTKATKCWQVEFPENAYTMLALVLHRTNPKHCHYSPLGDARERDECP